jgi:Transmembrane secretion effector
MPTGLLMRALEPMRVPAFRRLATSYTLNELVWSFGTIALAVLVFDRAGSALATTALFLATTSLPALVAPALIARVDALAVRRALPALYLAEAALFAGLATMTSRFWLPAVLALALLDGAVAIVARALTRAAVAAALRPTGALEAGNKLLNVAFSVAFAVGPALAGLVVAHAGAAVSLTIAAGLFVVMALTLGTCPSLPAASGDGDRSWRSRLMQSARYVRDRPALRSVLGAHALAVALFTAVMPIEIVYVKESLGAGDAAYGLLLAAWGAGTVLSSLGLAAARRSSPVAVMSLGAAAIGSGYLAMAVAPSPAVAVLGCLLGGLGNGIYYVSVVQWIQDRIEDGVQARVMGLLESINAAFLGIGFALGGLTTSVAGPRTTFAVSATGALLIAAAITVLLRGHRRAPAPHPARVEPDAAPA